MKKPLELSHDVWFGMSHQQQQETAAKYTVTIGPSYASDEDLEMLREMAPVALEVCRG